MDPPSTTPLRQLTEEAKEALSEFISSHHHLALLWEEREGARAEVERRRVAVECVRFLNHRAHNFKTPPPPPLP